MSGPPRYPCLVSHITRWHRLTAVAGLLLVASIAALWHPWSTQAGAAWANAVRQRPGGKCIPYRTTHLPADTPCMVMPWQVIEAGSWARFIEIAFPPGCFAGYPTAQVTQTHTAIRIKAFAWRPAIKRGRLDLTCGSGDRIHVRSAIRGRRIEGAAWPTPLHFGSFKRALIPAPLGIPRLLGLSPRAAERVLWLFGFHWRLGGRGTQIVAQLPGWGLVGKNRGKPNPYDGVTRLTAGAHIKIPAAPAVPHGARTGTIRGAVRFEGGAPNPHPRPIAGVVDLFNARGRLLAIFSVRARHYFRLRVVPGRYLLLDDGDDFCGPSRVSVHAARVAEVTVGVGCDVP